MNTNKPTLAFVDNGIHRLTGSGDFLRELLMPYFDISYYWDETWGNGTPIAPEEINKHDYVFFEQCINDIDELRNVKSKIIWSPMIDGYNKMHFFWKMLQGLQIKALSLSQAIHNVCLKYKIETFRAKYYVNPEKFRGVLLPNSGRHFFFWYRGDIRFSELKKFIRPEDVDSFIYKSNPDISYQTETLSEEDIIKYKITFIKQGYTPREEYLKQMSRANIYIAPRKKEGVGLSYIEAIAMGHCIIAYDNVTMNEYIEDEVNGYLIGNSHGKTIDFNNLQKITEESRKRAVEGYRNWEKSIPNIISFMKNESPQKTTRLLYPIYRRLYEIEKKIPWWKRTFFRHYIRMRNKYNPQ